MKTNLHKILVSIESSWNGARNIGNFSDKELAVLEAHSNSEIIDITESKGSMWASLTSKGRELLYDMNGRRSLIERAGI